MSLFVQRLASLFKSGEARQARIFRVRWLAMRSWVPGWLLLGALALQAQPQRAPRAGQALLPPPVAPGIESPRRSTLLPPEERAVSTNAAAASNAKSNLQSRVTAERERLNRNALQFQIDRAAEGSAVAMRSLGQRYLTGDLVEKNEEKAREWLKKAKDAGDPAAEILLQRLEKAALDAARTNSPPIRISVTN